MYFNSDSQSSLSTMSAPVGAVVEAQEMTEYLADARDVGLDLLIGEQLARFVAAGRVADLGGAAAHEDDGPVPGLLQAAQHHDLHQAADMQAVRGRIEADVRRHDSGPGSVVEAGGIGLLMNVAALIERAQEVGFERGHDEPGTPCKVQSLHRIYDT